MFVGERLESLPSKNLYAEVVLAATRRGRPLPMLLFMAGRSSVDFGVFGDMVETVPVSSSVSESGSEVTERTAGRDFLFEG